MPQFSRRIPPGMVGLTTQRATKQLISEIGFVLQDYRSRIGNNWPQILRSSFSSKSKDTNICWISLLILVIESFFFLSLWNTLITEAIIIFILTLLTLGLVIWENYKRLNELPVKISKMMAHLEDLVPGLEWTESVYPDLFMPLSPCITLQWCYRDSILVNLPWPLLVPGDLIIINPSQKVVAKCEVLKTKEILQQDSTFIPNRKESSTDDDLTNLEPKLRPQLESPFAIVLESPYKSVVQESLEFHLNRPTSFYTNERHIVVTRLIESKVLPLGLLTCVLICVLRLLYFPDWFGVNVTPWPWPDLIFPLPLAYTFPLIPLPLPVIVSFLHAIGNAKLYILISTLKKSCSKIEVKVQLGFKHIYREAWKFFAGREEVLHRSEKLLHVLATVTAFCCVDKKGVLSWPNPTADEIFFLKSSVNSKTKKRETVQEILDVTHDNTNAFELHFDEPTWEKHLPNLKPLGLNILLNTCNFKTHSTYSLFHSHIIHELHAIGSDLIIPVASRRCLCELARIIGFTDKATDVFKLEQELCCYRHIESDEACRNKLNKARIKFPFPHMMSVIVKEKACQTLQLMSQGTGDMILDVCEDFWDGTDLRPLTDLERKLILDFYQRTSLTSVCGAFAYKPALNKVNAELASLYLELPPSQGNRYLPYYSLSVESQFPTKDSSISSDCLYNLTEKRKSIERDVNDIDGCVDVQTRQVFLGMVAMQYEACVDMVQLIEQLDQACVRFVHFSKENELRSRLFSEKMGLESGWNCHISLSSAPEEEKELSIEHASLLLGNEKKSERRATFAALTRARTEKKRHRRLTETSNEVSEETNLLSRCSTSVPEMANFSYIASNGEKEDVLNEEDAKEKDFTDDETSMQVRVSFTNGAEADSTIRETPLGSFGDVGHRTPLGIDMSNRAKLPKGIEEIRHHLKRDIDNVPLLVSLFTDCSAETSREMLKIMQDYGEVVLLLGSVCNIDNPGLFLQADTSLALEPMYPQACGKQENFVLPKSKCALPIEVGSLLSGLTCPFVFKREDIATIYPVIAQARHFMNNCSRNTLQFWLSCHLSLTIFGLLGLLVMLPPIYELSDVLFLTCFIVPILALTLSFATMGSVERDIMELASWKNHFSVDRQIFTYVIRYYGMKFFPSLVNLICLTIFNLNWVCRGLGSGECKYVHPTFSPSDLKNKDNHYTNWNYGEYADRLLFIQQFTIFFLVLYLTLISSCFMYRFKYIWVRNPIFNKIWLLISVGVIFLQSIYSIIRLRVVDASTFAALPIASYVWAFVWVPVLVACNEFIRRLEIKSNIRYQKRARLDFGTKLGMHSPF